ncbi:uncharacterized protein F5147DRAFT_764391 [Suillus discolor]|uniref:Uncharacterized protein n=1 Tax=Suillus discolor TaxID=1912936 RepID=A0A9P7ETX0_9AGAM|nr:uncharacterized protein F5147DRAFT_764391 [Suillus discolor]KAG2090784.1 hypothetical protein F5147DRAFT_764391 [Suillus discolor]
MALPAFKSVIKALEKECDIVAGRIKSQLQEMNSPGTPSKHRTRPSTPPQKSPYKSAMKAKTQDVTPAKALTKACCVTYFPHCLALPPRGTCKANLLDQLKSQPPWQSMDSHWSPPRPPVCKFVPISVPGSAAVVQPRPKTYQDLGTIVHRTLMMGLYLHPLEQYCPVVIPESWCWYVLGVLIKPDSHIVIQSPIVPHATYEQS